MAYFFDPIMGGYRLICEATGTLSPVVATEERAVQGLEWYCDEPAAKEFYLARQRARFKLALVQRDILPEEAEDHAAALRWDLMPDGSVAGTPSDAKIAEAEAAFPALAQRARLVIAMDKVVFASGGAEVATITITGLVAPATADLGGGLTAQVSPADPVVRITSDIPKKFSVKIVDANHWSKPVEVEAV